MGLGQLFLDSLILCSDLSLTGTFVSVFLKLRTSRSSAGLSLQTLATVVSARSLHLISHFVGLHYQPTTVPWVFYPVLDVVNMVVGIACAALFLLVYYDSYEKEKDDFGIQVYQRLGLLKGMDVTRSRTLIAVSFLYVAIAVLALCWYFVRRSSLSFGLSYFCCFYEVMSALALIPQLWMFQKDKRVQPLLANFIVLTALSRLCTLTFWFAYPRVFIHSYPDNRGIQMASESVNILILSDFLYYWARAKLRGEKEVILDNGFDV
mmetsp:Transcript_96186/g.206398  ORF Transcript_96186/g.206398 Transcript_96186/m.206398 type:complete len:264 (-) Transcript_96186:98-889(-)